MHVSSSLPSTERMRGEALGSKETVEEEIVEEGTCDLISVVNVFLQLKLLCIYFFFFLSSSPCFFTVLRIEEVCHFL